MNEDELQRLHSRIDQLEKLIESLKNNQNPTYNITIDQAEFKSPVVDQLNYYFDKLDVKEVSGSLNLGNNFGIPLGKKHEKSPKSEPAMESKKAPEENNSPKDKVSHNVNKTDLTRSSNDDVKGHENHISQNENEPSTASSSEASAINKGLSNESSDPVSLTMAATLENEKDPSQPSEPSSLATTEDLNKRDVTSSSRKWTNRNWEPVKKKLNHSPQEKIPFKITINPRA